MPVVQRGESRLYYEVHGPESAACTVVLLHGVGGNHASWFNQISAWRDRFRVIVPDARGFGNSFDADGSGRDAFLADLEQVLAAEGVERCVLIGQSMGGGTAIDYACAHPGKVDALVLADTLFGIRLTDELREDMTDVARRTVDLSQQERVLGATFRARNPGQAMLYTALASFNRVNVRTLAGTQQEHAPSELAAIPAPILFLVGQEDALFPPAIVRRVHEQVAGSRFMDLPKVGHSAYFEAADTFNSVVAYWLEGVTGIEDRATAAPSP
ncbi:alpha/beta hydrolase [Variovorax sp. J22P168]|uniref:alpha/beta fold hydrolase n=1 Tax=Variovorax jilinensis TaxID=3053513 RepID=UPI002577DE79|nr:alpha/beta hydrolase [Variovorax sp. J22P168]MDM0015478.1 alpha/beta hydrolase [Variovorax sp. J22P168]